MLRPDRSFHSASWDTTNSDTDVDFERLESKDRAELPRLISYVRL